eukprot:CAMPEP_0185548352 /NCGR_PEP_ID=MMETSP1381-20130426/6709_1 /TAXON_ID=298111 /ORGANISM="Pavlova sp., Strain CCMP459" /LENGTH=69 /DNA_ID=CAMNT_0028160975 /DNA_START=366 /DNA_END=575 /DNA_ORIENTATION=+
MTAARAFWHPTEPRRTTVHKQGGALCKLVHTAAHDPTDIQGPMSPVGLQHHQHTRLVNSMAAVQLNSGR